MTNMIIFIVLDLFEEKKKKRNIYTKRLKKNINKKKKLRKSSLWVGESGVKYPSVLDLDKLRQNQIC